MAGLQVDNFSRWCRCVVIAAGSLAAAQAPQRIVGWGEGNFDSLRSESVDNVEVAAGLGCTYALRTDGTVAGLGLIGTAPPLPTGLRYVQVAAYEWDVLALRSDGSIVEWGDINGLAPVPQLPAGMTYTRVDAGPMFHVALRSDGWIVGWGTNWSPLAVPALPTGVTYVSLSAGHGHMLAQRSDGALIAWGSNQHGQCNVPALPNGVHYVHYHAGPFHCVALRSDGVAVAWGNNSHGETNIPALPVGRSWRWLTAGAQCTIGCRDDGLLVAWGDDDYGHLAVPNLPPGIEAAQVAIGIAHVVAVLTNGKLITWGKAGWAGAMPSLDMGAGIEDVAVNRDHVFARRRDGTVYQFPATPLQLPLQPSGAGYSHIDASELYVAAVTTVGDIVQAGTFGHATPASVPALPAGTRYTKVVTDGAHSLALRNDGEIVAWGNAQTGALVTPALPSGMRYDDVAIGDQDMALRSDGSLVRWSTSAAPTVIPRPVGARYLKIEGGIRRSFAIRNDGVIESWPPATPAAPALPAGTYYVEVDCDYSGTVARRSDGALVEWPHYGTPSWLVTPTIPAGETALALATGWNQRVAVTGASSLYTRLGQGCAGSRPAARMAPQDTPRIGRDLVVTLFDLPVDLAVLVVGFSTTNSGWVTLPLPLTSFGMPGCTLWTSVDATVVVAGQQHVAEHVLTIPDDTSLVGARLHQQALVFDPFAGNTLGAVVSDAMTAVVGR